MPSQGKSEGFDSCDWPSNLTQIGLKSSINQLMWPWNLMNDLQKQQGTSSILHQILCIILNPLVNSNWSYSPEMLNWGQKWRFFVPRDLEIWWMTSKNYRAPLLYYIKLGAAFQSHWHIQTGVTVRTRSIRVKIGENFYSGWPWNLMDDLKIIGHLFYTTLSLVQHFKAIGMFKLELQSGNAQFGSKLVIFFVPGDFENLRMTMKKIGHLFYTTSSFVHHFKSIGEVKLELQPRNAQVR